MDKTVTYDQPSPSPTQKVAVGAIAGAVTVVLVYLVKEVFEVDVPAEVASALTVLFSFVSSYLTKEKVSQGTVNAIAKKLK